MTCLQNVMLLVQRNIKLAEHILRKAGLEIKFSSKDLAYRLQNILILLCFCPTISDGIDS